jgi:diacylglycerol O-acyltransferase / wax synthase
MPSARLAPLDAAFLAVETPTAHMHVGWAASFAPPAGAERPRFRAILEHIEGRLARAPRFRQKLAPVPLGIHHPAWVDDPWFDVSRQVVHSTTGTLAEVVDECMSEPLPRDRPLWQVCVADQLGDGRIGIVGKAHHCMVDGIAAVELASLLVDPRPEPEPPEPVDWTPAPAPGSMELLRRAVFDRTREELELARLPARIVRSPGRVLGQVRRAAGALADAVRPAVPSALNDPISPLRHLAFVGRPIDDLIRIKQCFEVPLNDVVLAVSAGAVRSFLQSRGESPTRLKTMVPISVRAEGESGELGNRLSFMFIDLPCDEPDPARRLMDVHLATSKRKEAGGAQGASAVLKSLAYVPRALQGVLSRAAAGPRSFNLVVSNIPGPREPLYLLGCELREAYPVVPLADGHDLSIGMTTVRDRVCFGLYADRMTLPDVDLLARDLDLAIDELLERSVGEDLTEPAWAMP